MNIIVGVGTIVTKTQQFLFLNEHILHVPLSEVEIDLSVACFDGCLNISYPSFSLQLPAVAEDCCTRAH